MNASDPIKNICMHLVSWGHIWVVERTLAWLNGCRRLARDWETSIASSEAGMVVSFIRRMTRYC